jgi:hypothetical protein
MVNIMKQPFFRSWEPLTYSRFPPLLMGPKEPATGTYTEPGESSSHLQNLFLVFKIFGSHFECILTLSMYAT